MNLYEFDVATEEIHIKNDKSHIITRNGITYRPIYIVLYAGNTLLSNTIRTFTREDYSHIGISFDTSMNDVYSMRCATTMDGQVEDGPVIESFAKKKDRVVAKDDVRYCIYMKYVTEAQYKKLKEKVRQVFNNKENIRFSRIGLIRYAMHKESHYDNKLFCSEFVMRCMKSAGIPLDKDPSLYSPYQVATCLDFVEIEHGVIDNFNTEAFLRNVAVTAESIANSIEK